MRKQFYCLLVVTCLMAAMPLRSQDLAGLLEQDEKPTIDYASATFKTTRIVIGQSVEIPHQGELQFLITHHFGALNTGYENLYGLKQATIRLGLEYGVTKWLGLGVGLNTYKNTWDGFIKAKVLRQSKGAIKMPVTLDLFGNTAIYTTKWEYPDRTNYFSSRISYTFELLVARKFGNALSLQLVGSLVHKNLVPTAADKNNIFCAGGGGRVKVSERVSINAEYYHLFSGQVVSTTAYDSFSVGVDIETGGHIFQIFLTNSAGEIENYFLTETSGKWSNGEIFLGFNISRIFTVYTPKHRGK
jgi:hypothetical protein